MDYQQQKLTFDTTNQYQTLLAFPQHIQTGIDTGLKADLSSVDPRRIRNIVICGMGGSAIGGDILRGYAMQQTAVPVVVNRTYNLPGFVNEETLVITVSYSGTTEETLASYDEAAATGAQIVALTSGGALAAKAKTDGNTVLIVPGGLAPRYATGYLFPPLLALFGRLGLIPDQTRALDALLATAAKAVERYGNLADETNPAIAIAESLHGMLPVIYSPQQSLEAVNVRWRNQISENSKMLAYGNIFPEMNHNEIVGWEQNPEIMKHIAVIALHEKEQGASITRRMNITLDLIRGLAGSVQEIHADEDELLARIFGLICLGDWISYYLAIGTGTDPFPIEKINTLKNALAKG